jgi:predicted nucleic acid-binding protein
VTLFVDTSALYMVLDKDDARQSEATATLTEAIRRDERLVTHNYVVAEACALVQRRLGASAAADLLRVMAPQLDVRFVSVDVHEAAVSAFLAASSRSVSLVDRVSFEVMRREGIDTALAFDDDFAKAGFRTVP